MNESKPTGKVISTIEICLQASRDQNKLMMQDLENLEKTAKHLASSATPISDGIDPPSDWPLQQENQGRKVHDLLCKKCGKHHGWCLQEMATGHMEPLDICYTCMFSNVGEKKHSSLSLEALERGMLEFQISNIQERYKPFYVEPKDEK
jgi:hypothetical protein